MISAYIALRFQWKFAVPVLIALMHDMLITGGIYSLTGREVTSATVAALLTILGYSLYDTIIVFDRIRENMPRMPRAAFSQIANRSMSEVLTRSLATSFSTALPILALMLFGGETLRTSRSRCSSASISGAYSSIFIATPVLTHWKEREPVYARAARADRGASTAASCPPTRRRSSAASRSTSSPSSERGRAPAHRARPAGERPRRSSRSCGATSTSTTTGAARPRPRAAPRTRRDRRRRPQATQRADGDGDAARARRARRRRPRADEAENDGRRRGRRSRAAGAPAQTAASTGGALMGMLAWVMMGLAIWHFTIFLPDRFWGGIVGAFLGALFGAIVFGLVDQRLQVPGQATRTC